jgi:hypothetical protein
MGGSNELTLKESCLWVSAGSWDGLPYLRELDTGLTCGSGHGQERAGIRAVLHKVLPTATPIEQNPK